MCIKNIFLGGTKASPREYRLHQLYIGVCLAAFAVANGLIALRLAAAADGALPYDELRASYFAHPPIVTLNVLPAVVFTALGYFLTRRAWAAYLISALPTIGFALVNYYKVQLRGDPFLASDFRLIRTASGIMGNYTLDFTHVVQMTLLCVTAMLLFSILLLPGKMRRGGRARLVGLLVCLTALPLLYYGVYCSDALYEKTENNDVTNPWSDVELFASRGFWYPFLRSVSDAFPKPPPGYSAKAADATLAHYEDAVIPPEKKIAVVGVMLEAFSDLSDFPMLAELPGVQDAYAPLHELEAQSVSGDLLTNIFAGGTVDSEWGFLTGYSHHDEFRGDVDTFVRYFKAQGYDALYRHPGYSWFYNRRNINRFLGFDDSVFTEDGFGDLVAPVDALFHSDKILFDYLLSDLTSRTDADAPLFLFSVSYQNHGPYVDTLMENGAVSTAGTPWSAESRGILDHYLYGVGETARELLAFTQELEALDEPVVLVTYGDHKPWLGNDNSVYHELGVNIDVETMDGFYNFYSTPYLIWANSAAKAVLGNDFTGEGTDLSPCFLMSELFDLCGWDGPGFMALQREVRAVTPLVNDKGFYLENGELTNTLSPEAQELYLQYRCAEYRREHLPVN